MSALEKFREAEPLRDAMQYVLAKVIRDTEVPRFDRTLCQVFGVPLNMREARALRDCLTEVLP